MLTNNFTVKSEDIIKVVFHYTGQNPRGHVHGNYNYDDAVHCIRTKFGLSLLDFKRFLIKLKNDKLIEIQKIYRYDKIYSTVIWVNQSNLANKFDIHILKQESPSNYTRLVSNSLMGDLYQLTDVMGREVYTATLFSGDRCLSDKHDRHFTITNAGKMTYTPKGKRTVINDDGNWIADRKYRQEIKIGKGLRKIYKNQSIKIEDAVIEKLTYQLKSRYVFSGKIEIVKGDDIKKWYHEDNYSDSNTESLSQSCMRHSECQDYFDVYTQNEDKVSMIIAKNNDDYLIGRAILWKTDNMGLFCDRIYGNSITIEAIKDYAKKLGAYVKYQQSYNENAIVSTTGEVMKEEILITLKGGWSDFPYMDTMKYTDDTESETIRLSSHKGDLVLDSTEGGYPDSNMVTLHDGSRVHEDDARWVSAYSEYYYYDDTVYSDIENGYIVYNQAISINNGQDYAWDTNDNYIYAEDIETYMHVDDVIYSEYEDIHIAQYVYCVVHGAISTSNSTVWRTDITNLVCHKDVTVEELVEKGIIDEEQAKTIVNE